MILFDKVIELGRMEIVPVKSKKDLKDFVLLPWQIYRGNPFWVPQLISEVESTLDKEKNPFWKHADGELFLAKKKGRVVGRIAAIIDRLYLEKFKDDVGTFGFFESTDDGEVAELVLSRARDWLKERGMKTMRGPFNPSANDEWGLLIDGFDIPQYLMTPYNPPYYAAFMDRFGLRKARDWFEYICRFPKEPPGTAAAAAQFARKKFPSLTIRKIDMGNIKTESKIFREIYNSSLAENWAFVPMTEEEMDKMVERLRPLVVSDLILIAEVKGEPVGLIAFIPNYNEILKKLNGRLFPFGIFKFLYYSKKIKSLFLPVLGVKKEYRMSGIEAVMYCEALKNGVALGFEEFGTSLILENNLAPRKAAEAFGGEAAKKYRIYEIAI